jgi:hypothetical protein
VWQALHAELEPLGITVVTVALDSVVDMATPWIDAASPTHPSLIDTGHVTGDLFGFVNVPMAVWIDGHGVLVRPAELASVEARGPRPELPDGVPERLVKMMAEVGKLPDVGPAYREAVVDWARNGGASPFALSPDEVVARSRPHDADRARAAACFELGQHLFATVGHEAAVPWWREAHRLFPENFTYKRQAWTLVTTPEGADAPDLIQGPNDVYEGNWLDDVLAVGGGARYYPPSEFAP